MHVGLISDTHGVLRPEALAALCGSDYIVHAGDIGDASILERLSAIAPVTAVRGNNDHGEWAARLPETNRLDAGGVGIFVIHDVATLAIDPVAAGIAVIVSGHSHRPRSQWQGGVLYINPGSAGPRRFRLPVSIGKLDIAAGIIGAALVSLDVESASGAPRARARAAARNG